MVMETASTAPAMEIIELNSLGQVVRLFAKGQIVQHTLSSSDLLGESFAAKGYDRRVLLSLAEVTFVDSTGLGWLLKCNKLFRDAGGTLMIHSIPPVVLDVIDVRCEVLLNVAEGMVSIEEVMRAIPIEYLLPEQEQ